MNTWAYQRLASLYDQLMVEVDYAEWAEYILSLIKDHKQGTLRLVDLGCGTGSLAVELYRRGLDVVGVDISVEMLAVAANKGLEHGMSPQRWLKGDMRCLEFPASMADVIVSACDCFNYLRDESEVSASLRSISSCLAAGGLLLFDVHSLYKMEQVYGDSFFYDEVDDGLYLWRSHFDPQTGECEHHLTLFIATGDGMYRREDELHLQRFFSVETLTLLLQSTGFEVLHVFAFNTRESPGSQTERLQFVAKKV